ncbi:MAG: hypothetical protein ABI640_00235 [Gammaproteobacteria bacterium]
MARHLSMLAASFLLFATLASAQVGHPAKGAWSGYWGTSDADKHRILLVLDWRNAELSGTINPGPNAITLDKVGLDVDTWTLKLEAAMPDASGRKRPFVATGRLSNLGSWTNRTYAGTYTFGAEKGRFTVTLN